MSNRRSLLIAAVGIATMVGWLTCQPGGAMAGERCINVEVDRTLRLPDGSVHPAGVLRLCDTVHLSPVARVHRTYLNGRPLTMLLSRMARSEAGEDTPPTVFFRSTPEDQLELYGYVLPVAGGSLSFRLDGEETFVREDPQLALSPLRPAPTVALAASSQ